MRHSKNHPKSVNDTKLTCLQLLVEKDTGTTVMIQNLFANGKFNFKNVGAVSGAATCTEGYGSDKHDQGVRWSDIDGDGKTYQIQCFCA